MMRRSVLKLAVFLIAMGFATAATAQTPLQQVGRSVIWAELLPELEELSDARIESLFMGGSPGVTPSGQEFSMHFVLGGEVVVARLSGAGMYAALTYGVAKDLIREPAFECYMMGLCVAGTNMVTNGQGITITYVDQIGERFEWGGSAILTTSTQQWTVRATGGAYNTRGFQKPFKGPAFATTCSSTVSDSEGPWDTEGEAKGYIASRGAALAYSWALRGVSCVNFVRYLSITGDLAPQVYVTWQDLANDNVDPQKYFTFEGVEVYEDFPDASDPSDPTITTDPTDPSTPEPTVTTDPTDPSTPEPTDPSTDPTQEVDYESNCRIINLFCWARWAFEPKVQWAAEWSGLFQGLQDKAPFGYLAWLEQISAGDGAAPMGMQFSYAGYDFDVTSQPVIQWWMSTGRHWLMAVLYIGFFGYVLRAVMQ